MTVYRNAPAAAPSAITGSDFNFWYGAFHALTDVNLNIAKNKITAFIGPSGCGKSTFLRCMNRMNDLIEGTHIAYRGHAHRGHHAARRLGHLRRGR